MGTQPAAAKRLWETLESDFTNKSITYIMGVLADKEYEEMLATASAKSRAYLYGHTGQCQSLAGRKIAKDHRESFLCGACLSFFRGALYQALQAGDDMILAFGSLSYLGDFKKIVKAFVKE